MKIKGKKIVLDCHNCNKNFKKNEESVELKIWWGTDLIKICKECSKKMVGRCHFCHFPIYKSDFAYEVSISRGVEYILIFNEEEKRLQCVLCYCKSLTEKNGKGWKNRLLFTLLVISIICLSFLALPLFYPKLIKRWEKFSGFKKCSLVVLLFITPFIFYSIIQGFIIDRYKIRNRKFRRKNSKDNKKNHE